MKQSDTGVSDQKKVQHEFFVVGSLDEITPADFLNVQIDLEIRQKWDQYVNKLQLIYVHENTQTQLINWISNTVPEATSIHFLQTISGEFFDLFFECYGLLAIPILFTSNFNGSLLRSNPEDLLYFVTMSQR
ncbi:StAR-related lipid transfer protein 7, mitochondrial [Thelohanellus kitauei]|uniref:StAR-related lipid transfer protein 7, mitochondrial n=1 Tax=Thelohanellus kitauei TaxID=669202 RepID=A0A0C2M171_THEKT|nr:StAR-related lipid transfer protein 7, mitochondrial [Thelohanellus kitauei]